METAKAPLDVAWLRCALLTGAAGASTKVLEPSALPLSNLNDQLAYSGMLVVLVPQYSLDDFGFAGTRCHRAGVALFDGEINHAQDGTRFWCGRTGSAPGFSFASHLTVHLDLSHDLLRDSAPGIDGPTLGGLEHVDHVVERPHEMSVRGSSWGGRQASPSDLTRVALGPD